MKADRVTVRVPGGTRTRTLYSTVHGPVFTSILGLPLFPWSSAQAHAMGDVNAANFRYLNHFLETNMTQSVRQYDRVQRRNQGIPWVNSIAADSSGEAYYADIGAIPNVPNAKAQPVQHRPGHPDHEPARPADPRRLAHGLPVERRPRRAPARHVRPAQPARASSAATT